MVLPDEAELREEGTRSFLSQPGLPGPTGTGQEMNRLASRSSLWGGRPPGWCTEGERGVTGGKLAEEMASGCPGMHFGEEG